MYGIDKHPQHLARVEPKSFATTIKWFNVNLAASLRQTRLAGSLIGIAVVLLVTFIALHLKLNFATTGFLHLLVVVLVAMYSGFLEATATSLVSVACLNYFFIPPIFTFAVTDPQNWAALIAFEFTALVVSRLSQNVQRQARAATTQRQYMERLYEVSRYILLLNPKQDSLGSRIVTLIHQVFLLDEITLFNASSASFHSAGAGSEGLEQSTRDTYFKNTDRYDAERQVWFQVLRFGVKPTGALAIRGPEMTGLAATALASLTAIALEHARSFESESRAQATRDNEQLRTAVLDALAHQFKTPLTAIRTASSGLLEMEPLTTAQRELVTLIDDESERLNRLATRLLQTAQLESREMKLRRQPVLVADVVNVVLGTMQWPLAQHEVIVKCDSDVGSVSADPALCSAALAQLLDNAAKYSEPGSPINVSVSGAAGEVIIAVRNEGISIPGPEQERIFERFYRSPAVQYRAAGSGLGLSVAKKIIEAHHGRIWVRSEEGAGTTFCVSLPQVVTATKQDKL